MGLVAQVLPRSKRTMGKLAFCHIEDGSARIQLMLRVNEIGEENLKKFADLFDLGDFIQAKGSLMRSRTGEITILVNEYKMLAKAITPLPAAKDEVVDGEVVRHATLSDPENRYRQRYADLAVNSVVREIFRTRTSIYTRCTTLSGPARPFEVETPILQRSMVGQPLVVCHYHNQLLPEPVLRISFVLYLKRLWLVVRSRVYEIGA
jgi:lysyl-tRNA synthetase class 2